jgi:ClpP class serine protease
MIKPPYFRNVNKKKDIKQLLAVDDSYLMEHFTAFENPESLTPVSISDLAQTYEAGLNIGYNPESSTIFFKSHPQVAMIPVIGPTQKMGGWYGPGYMELSRMLSRIEKDDRYKAVMLYIDSPGGTVDGTQDWSEDLMGTSLPTMAFIDGLGASAGYWQAIATDKVIANSKNENFIGSVGVQSIYINQAKVLEKNVGDVRIFRAEQSQLKNRPNSIEPLTEEDEKKIIARLSEMAGKFISHVQARRPSIAADSPALKGEVYSGPEALENGLIDGLDSLPNALDELMRMAGGNEGNSNQTEQPNKNSMRFKAALTAILTALGFANVSSEEETPMVTEERLEALNQSLETANARIQELTGNVDTASSELTTVRNDLATMTTERDEWKEKAEKYGKNPGASHNQPPKEKAEGGNGEGDGDAQEFLNYAHNVEALNEIKNFS